MRLLKVCLIASLAFLGACSAKKGLTPGPHLTVAATNELPAPTPADLVGENRPYLIGPFDELSISVFGLPELTQQVQADASGRVSLPLVGAIDARAKTPDQLGKEIEDKLRGRYVRDPQVTVNVVETVNHTATISGEVRTPGVYPVLGRMTLMRAIATAQGTTEFARLQDVVVFRTVAGQNMAALYNLDAIRRGAYPDPQIYANDVVVVGNSPARRLFRDLLQASGLITAPLVTVLQPR